MVTKTNFCHIVSDIIEAVRDPRSVTINVVGDVKVFPFENEPLDVRVGRPADNLTPA